MIGAPAHDTVHVVDQGRRFVERVTRVLEAEGHRVRAHASAAPFFDALDAGDGGAAPDDQASCVVCELRMEGVDGLKLAERLEATHPCPPPIIFVGAPGDVTGAVAGMRRGAVDHLEQPISAERLVRSVDTALARDRELRRRCAERAELDGRYARLTAREREVFTALMTEQTAKRIAALLGISPRTAEHHREGLMRKMGARSWQELLVMAILLGLYEPQLPVRTPSSAVEADTVARSSSSATGAHEAEPAHRITESVHD